MRVEETSPRSFGFLSETQSEMLRQAAWNGLNELWGHDFQSFSDVGDIASYQKALILDTQLDNDRGDEVDPAIYFNIEASCTSDGISEGPICRRYHNLNISQTVTENREVALGVLALMTDDLEDDLDPWSEHLRRMNIEEDTLLATRTVTYTCPGTPKPIFISQYFSLKVDSVEIDKIEADFSDGDEERILDMRKNPIADRISTKDREAIISIFGLYGIKLPLKKENTRTFSPKSILNNIFPKSWYSRAGH